MSLRNVRYILEYGLYWVVTRTIRLAPHRWIGSLGSALGRLLFAIPGSRRRLTLANLERALPHLSGADRNTLAARCFQHWTRIFFESISLARFGTADLEELFQVEGLENLEEAKRAQRGILITSGHFGAFEIASYVLGAHAGEVHILVRQQSNPWVDRETTRLRTRTGNILLPRHRAGHRMLNVLRSGGTVGIGIDQRVKPADGILVPFLGEPAWTGTLTAYLSTLSGAPTVPIVAVPTVAGRYKITFGPPIFPDGQGDERVAALTQRYAKTIESDVRRHPELWFWMHSRWRRCSHHSWPTTLERLRQSSGLSGPSDLDDSRFEQPTRSALRGLFDESFLEEGGNAVLFGGDRDLRLQISNSLGTRLLDIGHPILLLNARELAGDLAAKERQGTLEAEIRKLDRLDLLILTEIQEVDGQTAGSEHLAKLLDHRRGSRSVLATTSHPESASGSETGSETALPVPPALHYFESARRVSLAT